jgi:hypothetical protein
MIKTKKIYIYIYIYIYILFFIMANYLLKDHIHILSIFNPTYAYKAQTLNIKISTIHV